MMHSLSEAACSCHFLRSASSEQIITPLAPCFWSFSILVSYWLCSFFHCGGWGQWGESWFLLKFCNFFFFCLGAYRSLLSGWGPLKRKYLLKISKNPEPLKTFFSCDCLAVSHWDLVISPLIALTDNLEYVGFLSLVSLFTLKTCCQLFPFRMESSPGEWLVAFRSSFPF